QKRPPAGHRGRTAPPDAARGGPRALSRTLLARARRNRREHFGPEFQPFDLMLANGVVHRMERSDGTAHAQEPIPQDHPDRGRPAPHDLFHYHIVAILLAHGASPMT